MATTRIMPLHVGKGRTESRAISDIIDYVANPKKTDNGRLITGYACDSRTADAEFLLAKRQYIDVTPHQLRHTYITNLLYAGVDPKTVQYLAGHENSKTTMDIYAKVKYNKPEELFGVVNGAFHQAIAE